MDPTRKDNGVPDVATLRRPNGGILITWDPNTGGIDFRSNGVGKIEEIGLLQWALSMRMCDHLGVLGEKSAVSKILTPMAMPPGMKQ